MYFGSSFLHGQIRGSKVNICFRYLVIGIIMVDQMIILQLSRKLYFIILLRLIKSKQMIDASVLLLFLLNDCDNVNH